MKTIDESGTMLTTEPDLEAGYLVEDVEVVHHDAVEGTAPQWHRETAKLPDGSLAIYYRDGKEIGRDMVKIVDVPGVDPQPAWDEEVPVMRYIRYTAEELAAQAEAKKKAEEAAAAEAKKKAELETVPGRMDALEAASAAVWVHGKAGDLMAEQYGRRGMTASNVMLEGIPAVLKELE